MAERIDDICDVIIARLAERLSSAPVKAELHELEMLASSIEGSLRHARRDADALAETIEDVASRAHDAERALGLALTWACEIEDRE